MEKIEIDFEIKKEQVDGMLAAELQEQLKDAISSNISGRISDSIENGKYVSIEPNDREGYDISLSIVIIDKEMLDEAIGQTIDKITSYCSDISFDDIKTILAPLSFNKEESEEE